ncbi:tetratricopeptide repeat protein [Pedobacter sp. AW31-3R]|uniref:sensor histidine kinase n=1 Tax=Pedobacter sp. AW31-3R TaxID=3445781 RepID=UPI003FA1601B
MKVINLVACCLTMSGYAFAQSPLPAILSELKKATQDSIRVLAYYKLANYYCIPDPDSAQFYNTKGLALAERINYPKGIASMNASIARSYSKSGQMDLAKKHYLLALNLFKKLKDLRGITAAENGLGITAASQGMNKEATTHFLAALAINQRRHDTIGMIESHIKIGRLELQHTNNPDKALEYYQRGLRLSNALTPPSTAGSLLNNIGTAYALKNDLNTALQYFLRALKLSAAHEYTELRLLSLINIGNVYQEQGDLATAMKYQKQVLALSRNRKLPEQEARALVNLASIISTAQPDSSARLLEQALVIAQTVKLPHMRLDIYESMVDLHKGTGNYRKVTETLEAQIQLKDSLFTIKKSKEIAGLQANFDLINEKLKIQRLQLKNEQIESSRKAILLISSAITLILIIIIFFYTRTKQLNHGLLQQKNQLDKLNNYKDRLFSIIGHDLKSPLINIVNMLDLYETKTLSNQDVQQIVPQLKEQTEGTLDILEKLLAWGKLHIKGANLNKTTFNAKELIQKNISLYRTTAIEKSLQLTDETPAEILMYADITYVDFVIRNLITNAIKYTHAGGKIEVLAAFNQKEGFNTLTIKDNGIGIAKEFQEKIFEPLNKSTNGTANEAGNSLGLMLCKEFIRENGGFLELKSELGKGTEFCISFPYAQS